MFFLIGQQIASYLRAVWIILFELYLKKKRYLEVFIFHFFSFGQFCQGDSSLFNDASMGMVQVITSIYTTHNQNKGRNKIQIQNTKYKSMGMVQVITSFYTTHHQNKGRNKIQTQNTKYKSMGMVQVLRPLYKKQKEETTKVHDLLSKETEMPRSWFLSIIYFPQKCTIIPIGNL